MVTPTSYDCLSIWQQKGRILVEFEVSSSFKMAGYTALLFLILAICAAAGVRAEGELDVIHAPASLKWTGHSRLRESLLKEIYSASLGLSVEENSDWSCLSITDPFNTPEAVVEVYIDGIPSLGNAAHLKSHRYPLALDEYDLDTFDTLSHRIQQRYADGGSKLVRVTLDDQTNLNEYSSIFGNIKITKVSKRTLEYLKPGTQEEDAQFLQELDVLKAIAEKVESGAVTPDNVIDFYHLRFQSLHPLSDLHGPNSLQTKEAKKLLGETLEQLSAAFVQAYDGSVLVTSVSSDATHTRRTARSLKQSGNAAIDKYNVAAKYSGDYPVMFNIILWFSFVFVFSLLAIVYAIMDMDPGRDSIIYRMTSMRSMKKDN